MLATVWHNAQIIYVTQLIYVHSLSCKPWGQETGVLSSGAWVKLAYPPHTTTWNNAPNSSTKSTMPPEGEISVCRMPFGGIVVVHPLSMPPKHLSVISVPDSQHLLIKNNSVHLLKTNHKQECQCCFAATKYKNLRDINLAKINGPANYCFMHIYPSYW